MKTFKIGIVGAGNISKMHLDGYKKHTDVIEVTAICDPNAETLEQRAKEYNIAQKFTNVEDLIENSGIDIAVVCTPTSVRKNVLKPLILAGIPIFCEKPFSDMFEEAEEITALAEKEGVKITVNQNFRNHYIFDEFRNMIENGDIGKVVNINLKSTHFRRDIGWRNDCERHCLSIMGIHWFDGFRWMLKSEAKSLYCQMSSSSAIGCTGETDANVLIEFENGAVASMTQSFSSLYGKDELHVIGDRGALVCVNGNAKYFSIDNGSKPVREWDFSYDKPESAYDGLKNLIEWIASGVPAPNSAADNLKSVAILEAAYKSAKDRKPVFFNEGRIKE